MSTETTPEPEEWRKVSGPDGDLSWYVLGLGREWIADVPTEAIADEIIRDHKAALQASKGMALLAGEVADARQEAREAKTAARIAEEALRSLITGLRSPMWGVGSGELELAIFQEAESALASLSREEK